MATALLTAVLLLPAVSLATSEASRATAGKPLIPQRTARAADETAAAPRAPAAGAVELPPTDARLHQKVTVHACYQPLSELLAGLSRATGVTLIAHLEIADEPVSLWSTDRALLDVMRDLRHLYGYFWSRAKRSGGYVYSLWQDAQGRAREEAELQRLALEQQRQFEEGVRKRLKALSASDEELKRLARDEPYLFVQMRHPVVRGGYQLFAALSPDQQAPLLNGRTPSRGQLAGHLAQIIPSEYREGDKYLEPTRVLKRYQPNGDLVTLRGEEMTAAQRAALGSVVRGAADWELKGIPEAARRGDGARYEAALRALGSADLGAANVTFFRWGEPAWQGIGLRVDLPSGGRSWMVYSNIAISPRSEQYCNDALRKGEFRVWPEAQEEWSRAVRGTSNGKHQSAPETPAAKKHAADSVLDAPVTLKWKLPLRDPEHFQLQLRPQEILALLHRDLGRPLVASGLPSRIQRDPGSDPIFRVEKRPLREVLEYFFPGWEMEVSGETLYLRDPERISQRLWKLPRAVEEFLKTRNETLTLDDMALLARSLTPWQVVWLQGHIPGPAVDQLLETQELVKLYGELAPAQRARLPQGIPYAALTPTQQALFVAFAQRQRPFVEPWRFQAGSVRLASSKPPAQSDDPFDETPPAARVLFAVQFQDGDRQSFPLDLYPRRKQRLVEYPKGMVGRPFPFPPRNPHYEAKYKAALLDDRLRKRPLVLQLSWSFAWPYAGTGAPPAPADLARTLAMRLQNTNVTVADVAIGGLEPAHTSSVDPWLSRFLHLSEAGDIGGNPYNWSWTNYHIRQSPTVFVLDREEVVRALFEGRDACDTAAIARAARAVAAGAGGAATGARK